MKCILLLICSLFSFTTVLSQSASEKKYETYVQNKRCSDGKSVNCLEKTSYTAIRSDGRKVRVEDVYNLKSNKNGIFESHFLTEYIKLLRNAYYASPKYGSQLYNQIDYLVSHSISRNGALVWENKEGIAQAMEQGEYAYLFASCAKAFEHHKDIKSAKGIMNYALSFFRSFNMAAGVRTGGVTSFGGYAGAKKARFRQSYWFHSRGLGIVDAPGVRTVLNQHLHAIRDLLALYIIVMESSNLIDAKFGTLNQVLNEIEDKAIGGLYQLAFSNGHKGISPNRPPNISQFMNLKRKAVRPTEKHPDGNPMNYYWAYYEYSMKDGKGLNISDSATCHYHTHVLNLFANIYSILQNNKMTFQETENGWRLFEAVSALTKGNKEKRGLVGSNNAIYQFYKSESKTIKKRRENCPDNKESLNDIAIEVYEKLFE